MKRFVLIMLALSLVVAGGVSWFASSHPDGLERVAEDLGFLDRVQEPAHTVMPDYTVPGKEGFLSNGLAGVTGVLATFGATILFARLARRRKDVARGESAGTDNLPQGRGE